MCDLGCHSHRQMTYTKFYVAKTLGRVCCSMQNKEIRPSDYSPTNIFILPAVEPSRFWCVEGVFEQTRSALLHQLSPSENENAI